MTSSTQLQQRADKARERLTERLEDLRYHVSPSTVINDVIGGLTASKGRDDVLATLVQQARKNPIAYVLIAAGVGWLIFSDMYQPQRRRPVGANRRTPAARRRAKSRRRH